jgi:hypothetical protein
MVVGPSGWTRTTTARVKSPACCVDTTEGSNRCWSEWRDSNPHLKAWKARRQPLPHIRSGSAYGYRTRPSALATRDAASTPRPNTDRRCRSMRHPSVVKDPALSSLVGGKGFEPNCSRWENGVTGRQRTIRTYRPIGDSARTRTRTHKLWRLGCSRYTTLPMSTSTYAIVCEDRTSLRPGGLSSRRQAKQQKRPSRGSPQKACFAMTAGPLGRVASLIERATEVAIDPGFAHGSRHTGFDSQAGQIAWPRLR